MRLALDTSVIVAAFRSPTGASRHLLELMGAGRFAGIITPALFLEWEQVLKREEHLQVHKLSFTDLDDFLANFLDHLEPARIHYRWRPQLTDVQDEMVLEAALNGRADAIITHNVKDLWPARQMFGVSVLTPAQLLRKVGL